MTGLLILGLVLVFIATAVMYLRFEKGRLAVQTQLYGALASQFGLTVHATKNPAGLPMSPIIAGVHRGREVRIDGGYSRAEYLMQHAPRFGQIGGMWSDKLKVIRAATLTWVEVTCANPRGLAFYLVADKGRGTTTEFDRNFTVVFAEGSASAGPQVLTDRLVQALIALVNEKLVKSFETFALVNNSLFYVEHGRLMRPDQAARFARMAEIMFEVADKVDG